jgi:acyl transferase domain-containing protein
MNDFSQQLANLTPKQRAVLALKEAEARRPPAPEPVAIIGLACRFPGAANAAAFWRLLRDGTDAVTEVPPQRWDADAYFDPDPAAPGKMNTRWGGFLDDIDQLDAHFFGISQREAAQMDPQQRLVAELAYEALEDAGLAPSRLAGTRVGVFLGISNNEYARLQLDRLHEGDAFAATGSALCIGANRLSYLFDFRGPSLAIDTA